MLFCVFLLLSVTLYAQSGAVTGGWPVLAGTKGGLYGLEWSGKYTSLWADGSVKKIIQTRDGWLILSSEGIHFSPNFLEWENRSGGLPVKNIKVFDNGEKTFLPMVQDIKDLEICPTQDEILVCATRDNVYLSRSQGRFWQNIGSPPFRTNGIKAVAAAYLPADEGGAVLTVFVSHSTYGVFYLQPDNPGAQWTEISKGLEKMETTDNADEVSDITVVQRKNDSVEIYVSQTFRRRIYVLDWEKKVFIPVWNDGLSFGSIDSLDAGNGRLRFIGEGAIAEIGYYEAQTKGVTENYRLRSDILENIRTVCSGLRLKPDCIVIPENRNQSSELINLSELWLLNEAPPAYSSSAVQSSPQAMGKEGLYLPVNHAMDNYSLKPYLDIIDNRDLNMVVIDMKDDYGRLRFTPKNPEISKKGRVFNPLDIETFLSTMKSHHIYTVARIVVFKDPVLASRDGNKYAVWDKKENKPWAGYYDTRRKKPDVPDEFPREDLIERIATNDPEYEIIRTFYDERWVDPYCEEVWDYIAATAAELHERGFDEIQFDYIRFPTDGINLANANYRWQDSGMDMESALLSFLCHIRARVKAPISVDIYGANGWYRTGARTGQDVELISPFIDVICPMYYPSHFEQNFLAQTPEEMRPFRIYYQGTMRTNYISRGQVIVRPYVQAFYLNVSYDRKYYNIDYVRRQIEGVRSAGSPGFTYWNNSGRYDDIPYP